MCEAPPMTAVTQKSAAAKRIQTRTKEIGQTLERQRLARKNWEQRLSKSPLYRVWAKLRDSVAVL